MRSRAWVLASVGLAVLAAGCLFSNDDKKDDDVTKYETNFTKVTTKPYVSAGHGGVFVEIWTNGTALSGYRTGKSPMPVGSIIAKERFRNDGSVAGPVVEYYVMKKMEPGYDPDNHDWYYAVRQAGTNAVQMEGRIAMCIGCHQEVVSRDYLYGVPDSVKVL